MFTGPHRLERTNSLSRVLVPLTVSKRPYPFRRSQSVSLAVQRRLSGSRLSAFAATTSQSYNRTPCLSYSIVSLFALQVPMEPSEPLLKHDPHVIKFVTSCAQAGPRSSWWYDPVGQVFLRLASVGHYGPSFRFLCTVERILQCAARRFRLS